MAITNADGSIVLTTKVDQSGLKKGMSTMKSGVSSLIGSFGKLAAAVGVAFSVGALIKFSKEVSNLATTAEASVQRLIDIYGEASKAVGDFIDENANALGMSRAAAASYASVYGNLFSVWADQQTNAALTTKYLNMTAVVASKTGRTVEDVQERVRSGLLGNTEAIEDLGIFVNVKTIEMTDAFQRMAAGKSWEQLDAYTQQQIRTFAILEQATAKYGNEVAQTSALTKSQFQAAWQDFQATWGQVVNRILMPVLKVLTDILVTSNAVMQSLFGVSSSTISQSEAIENAVNNQKELTKEIGQTEKAAKKALAPFDDLQIITSGASETKNEGGNFIIPPLDISIPEQGGNLDNLTARLEKLKTFIDPIKQSFVDLWEVVKPNETDVLSSFEMLKTDVFEPFGLYISADLIPEFVGSFEKAFQTIEDLGVQLAEPLQKMWDDTLKPMFSSVGDWVLSIIQQTGDSFSYISEQITKYSDEISMILDALAAGFKLVWGVVEPIIDSVIDGIGNVLTTTIDAVFGIIQVVGNIFGFFKNLFASLVALFSGNMEEAEYYTKMAANNFTNIFIGLANTIISILNNVWSLIFDSIKGTINAVGGLISGIADLVGVDLDLRWDAKAPLIPLIPKSVPALARGAVIPPNREFLAVLGDQKQGTNIEAPAELIKQMVMEAMAEMGGYNSGKNTEVILEIDGREFGRAVVEQGNRENRRIGTKLVIA